MTGFVRSMTAAGYADTTIANYGRSLLRLALVCPEPASPGDLSDAMERLIVEQGDSPGYVANQVHAWRRFWRWLAERHGAEDIAKDIKPPPQPQVAQPFLESGDLGRALTILRSLPGRGGSVWRAQERAIAAVLFMGARGVELRRLRVGDIDWQSRSVILRGKGRPRSGPKLRRIGLTDRALTALRCWIRLGEPEGLLFRNRDGGPLTKGAVEAILRKLSRELGVHVTPHTIRRSCCDHICREMGVEVAQHLLGHSSVRTTLRSYRSVRVEETREAVKGLERL